MLKEEIQEYNARVIQASEGELVVITYELILDFISQAETQISQEDRHNFHQTIKKAQKTLRTLTDTLDFGYDISRQLMSLYLFVNQRLVQALVKESSDPLDEARKVMKILLDGWKEACAKEQADPVISNAQKLYAGLTYGKGTLNETVMGENGQRGFKA